MNKIKGKALSLVLSLALVISSFSAVPASASSKTVTGTLNEGTAAADEIYLVNGGTLTEDGVGALIGGSNPELETDRHVTTSAKIASISHASGDRLVKWSDINDDTTDANIDFTLKSDTVSGHEVLNVLYKGSYTDEDDNTINVKATKKFDVYVYDKNQTVIGLKATDSDHNVKGELDDDFYQKTLAHAIDSTEPQDLKDLAVLKAGPTAGSAEVTWTALKTVVKPSGTGAVDYSKSDAQTSTETDGVYYTLKVSSNNIKLTNTGASDASDASFATVAKTEIAPGLALSGDKTKITIEAPTKGLDAGHTYVYTSSTNGETPAAATSENTVTEVSLAGLTGTKAIKVAAYDFDGTSSYTLVGVATGSYTAANAGSDGTGSVTATVIDKAGTGSLTFTAEPTYWAKNDVKDDGTSKGIIASSKPVTVKSKINKSIKVVTGTGAEKDFRNIGKYSGKTYLYKGTLNNDAVKKDATPVTAVDITSYIVDFTDATNKPTVTVDDKASVTEIDGTVDTLVIGEASVTKVDLDAGAVTVDDSKVGSITTDDGKVTVSSQKASVGDIDASSVEVNSGKTGSIKADTSVDVSADEDDSTTQVGDITAVTVIVDSKDSAVSTGTIKASDADSTFTIKGSNNTIKGFDFDYYNTNLSFEDFQGKIAAPAKADADGATIATTDGNDRVEVVGNSKIDAVSIEDESVLTFDGSVDVTSIDGSGILVVGAGKLYVDGSVTGPYLRLSDASLTAGQTVFTSLSDTVNEDDFTPYGFTLTKVGGSTRDTFKVKSLAFAGMTINKSSSKIAKGNSEVFSASAYAPGTKIPAGYKVEWNLDADDSILTGKVNADGTYTVTCVDADADFASENKGTLTAYLVDEYGDVDDQYTTGECDLTATAIPDVAYTSDTAVKAMKVGDTYRFRITSTAGTQPKNFAVASNGASVTYRGNSGKDYFYDVKAAQVGSFGVYVDGSKLAVLNITNAFSIDTKTVSVNAGASYQFKVTGATQPTLAVAGIGNIKLASKSGNDYFFKVAVPTNLAKGGHGVYVNGVVLSVLTVK